MDCVIQARAASVPVRRIAWIRVSQIAGRFHKACELNRQKTMTMTRSWLFE
jgi:hypothetical protein